MAYGRHSFDRYEVIVNKIIAVLVVMLLIGAAWLDAAPPKPTLDCIPADVREKVRALSKRAIDDAFQDQVKNVFEVWMRDPTGQPDRARKGLNNAIKAYVESVADAEAWTAKECGGG